MFVKMLTGSLLLAASTGAALAQDVPTMRGSFVEFRPTAQENVSGPVAHRLAQRDDSSVLLIRRHVAVPAATVSRALSEQPVRPFLAEIRVGKLTTFVDPLIDYENQDGMHLDDNHSIIQAQRLHQALQAQAVGVLLITPELDYPFLAGPRPLMIMLKPDDLERRQPTPQPGEMPTVPHQQVPAPQVAAR